MIDLLRRYFAQFDALYTDPTERYHARILGSLSIFIIVFSVFFIMGALGTQSESFATPAGIALMVLPTPAGVLTVSLLNRKRLPAARWFMFMFFFIFMVAIAITLNLLRYPAIVLLLAPMLGSALFGVQGIVLGVVMALVTIAFAVGGEYVGILPERMRLQPGLFGGLFTVASAVVTTGFLLWFMTRASHLALQAARHRIARFRLTAEVGRFVNQNLTNPALFSELVNLIKEQLDLYHVQIFLLDTPRQNAVLTASTGELGAQLMARDHQLPVGSRSVIGRVTGAGQRVYVADTARSGVHRQNDILTESRAEIAFPLLVGGSVIGALDLQSMQPNAFSESDIQILTDVAGLVAAAVSNYQLLENSRNEVERTRRQYEQVRQTLTQTERVNRQLTRQAWEDYLTSGQGQFGIHLEGSELVPEAAWTDALRKAVMNNRAVVEPEDENAVTVAVPLEVRGLPLGALEVSLPDSGASDDALELIEAVANRLALALDNNRLFEEASTRAEQERKIGEIASQLQSTVEVEEMLKIAVQELQSAIGANRGSIRLRSTLAASPAEAGQQ